jgi:DeoR family transcriptional regulator of aga operon
LAIAVLGIDVVDPKQGAYAHHEDEASINRLPAERAHRVAVTADSFEIGKRAFAKSCGIDTVDTLITGEDNSAEAVDRFKEAGVTVTTV